MRLGAPSGASAGCGLCGVLGVEKCDELLGRGDAIAVGEELGDLVPLRGGFRSMQKRFSRRN
jgi:hypothetical protein